MGVPVRNWTHWALGYAPSRAMLSVLGRRGDPLAQLITIDIRPVDDIYPLIEQIRRRGRMSRVTSLSGWVTADAQIVREVLRDGRFRTLKPQDRSVFRAVQWMLAKTNPNVLNPLEPPSLLVSDPPEHTRLRRPVSRAFTPRALDGLRARVHEVVDELLRRLEGRTDCDLVAEYTSQIPLAIIAEMMGVPPGEAPYLQEVAGTISNMIGTTSASWRDFRSGTAIMREFDEYLGEHVERLRNDRTADSIMSDVVRSGDLTEAELRGLAGLLLGAGFVTTAHVMSKAIVALIRHPDQLATLSADPDGWPNAVEEILRYDTAGQLVPRIATEDLDIQGYSVRKDEPIFLLAGGANRDPAVFADPDVFDVTRANAREHISFGTGLHVCLGAALARMELHVGLQSLFERYPHLTLAGDPIFNRTIGLHGLTYLPVALGAAQSIGSTH
ncbi:cytochrome [Mycobacterium sp. 1245111.1]|uniref:cytochrome P450 n=1 Tax=Mycobacterium sp. 1245111.1 TaxID=1834073 RepID=UPI0007FBAB07|nr:cytochrome P450 [Mycobacterium sp. 1245111.1]OBK40774.1 cytochrome [Mycobacterium sp. 1245111.1]